MRRRNAWCQRVSVAVGVGATQACRTVLGGSLRIPRLRSQANPDHDRSAVEASSRAIGVNVDGDGHTARSGSIHIVSVGKRRERTGRQVSARRRTGVRRPCPRPHGVTGRVAHRDHSSHQPTLLTARNGAIENSDRCIPIGVAKAPANFLTTPANRLFSSRRCVISE
jgi:hypothetical protein